MRRSVSRTVRWALRRYVRARPRRPEEVVILLGSAWGMGGTIRATLNLAGHLAQRHEVEILSFIRQRDEPFFPFPENVRVTALDDQRPGAAGGVLRRLLVRRPSVLLHPQDRLYPNASLWSDVALVRRLRGRRGFLIGTRPGLNLVAAQLSPPGLITIGQEQMHLRAHVPPLRRAMRLWYPRLDALVVLTDRDRGRYERLLGDGDRLHVIPNTVRPNLGPPAPLEGTTVLAAGRLTPQKGFDLLIKAFSRVAAAHPDWRLLICGEGPSRPRLERIVARRGLEEVVSLPGPVEPLEAAMDQAAVFVLSSRYEGFPLVLLEAMAKGLPVVAYRCPTGPEEIIDDHRDGILVPPRSIRALGDALAEVMDDADLRGRLGAAAAQTARAYTMDAIGPRWDALLAELRGATSVAHPADMGG